MTRIKKINSVIWKQVNTIANITVATDPYNAFYVKTYKINK